MSRTCTRNEPAKLEISLSEEMICELCGEPLFEKDKSPIVMLKPCHHLFHGECFREMVDADNCPVCGATIHQRCSVDLTRLVSGDLLEARQLIQETCALDRISVVYRGEEFQYRIDSKTTFKELIDCASQDPGFSLDDCKITCQHAGMGVHLYMGPELEVDYWGLLYKPIDLGDPVTKHPRSGPLMVETAEVVKIRDPFGRDHCVKYFKGERISRLQSRLLRSMSGLPKRLQHKIAGYKGENDIYGWGGINFFEISPERLVLTRDAEPSEKSELIVPMNSQTDRYRGDDLILEPTVNLKDFRDSSGKNYYSGLGVFHQDSQKRFLSLSATIGSLEKNARYATHPSSEPAMIHPVESSGVSAPGAPGSDVVKSHGASAPGAPGSYVIRYPGASAPGAPGASVIWSDAVESSGASTPGLLDHKRLPLHFPSSDAQDEPVSSWHHPRGSRFPPAMDAQPQSTELSEEQLREIRRSIDTLTNLGRSCPLFENSVITNGGVIIFNPEIDFLPKYGKDRVKLLIYGRPSRATVHYREANRYPGYGGTRGPRPWPRYSFTVPREAWTSSTPARIQDLYPSPPQVGLGVTDYSPVDVVARIDYSRLVSDEWQEIVSFFQFKTHSISPVEKVKSLIEDMAKELLVNLTEKGFLSKIFGGLEASLEREGMLLSEEEWRSAHDGDMIGFHAYNDSTGEYWPARHPATFKLEFVE
jgi:hypothetical protein